MITGYELINGYYEDEKLYSTGDSELDDLLEKAFCDGYEYYQREFSSLKQILDKKTKTDAEWTRAFNTVGPEKKIGSWSQLQRNNMKRNIKKDPKGFNNIVSSYVNRGYKNKGGKPSSSAHKLSGQDFLKLNTIK